MMIDDIKLKALLDRKEDDTLAFIPVLPPSKILSQVIGAFANVNGGTLIIGALTNKIIGLSSDYNVTTILNKAISLLNPKPKIDNFYKNYDGKSLYIIIVEKSYDVIYLNKDVYKRQGCKIINENKPVALKITNIFSKIIGLLESDVKVSTESKYNFIKHYFDVINILDKTLLPEFNINEKNILFRILFSSCADTFEKYLSDLLFEIYLAKPEVLKSKEKITIEEVLNCKDIEEFIIFFARKKIGDMQKGSVKNFLDENKVISDLNAIDVNEQKEIEKIMQIRHLCSHKNGIVDDKFQQYFPDEQIRAEFSLSIDVIIDKLIIVINVIEKIDCLARKKYNLSEYVN